MDILYKMKREMLRLGYTQMTVKTYSDVIKLFMKSCPKEFKRITKGDVTEFLNDGAERGLSHSTLNVYLSALKFMLENVLGRRIAARIPCSKKAKRLPEFYTRQEIRKIFNAVDNDKHLLVLEVIYSAGLRVSEAVKLRKKDLDFDIQVGWVREGKGRKDRAFIIADRIKDKLLEAVDAKCKTGIDYIFPGRAGHLTVRSVQEILKKASKTAGVDKRMHPHALRHSFATHLIEDGYDVTSVQPLLGHTNIETTMMYVHMAAPSKLKIKSPYDKMMDDVD